MAMRALLAYSGRRCCIMDGGDAVAVFIINV
jgi:hypothetical protein